MPEMLVCRRVPVATVLAVMMSGLAACDRQGLGTPPSPLGPSPQPDASSPLSTPSNPSRLEVSGQVLQYAGGPPVPLPNARLVATVSELIEPGGWRRRIVLVHLTSDGAGFYELSLAADSGVSIAPERGSGYYAPCPNGADVVTTSRRLDVHVVPEAVLSTSGMPDNVPRHLGWGVIWVSGVVFEHTAAGREPVAGASVFLNRDSLKPGDPFTGFGGSLTLTDRHGRYLVCPQHPGSGTDQYGSIDVEKAGYRPASAQPFLGWDYDGFDVELVRQ